MPAARRHQPSLPTAGQQRGTTAASRRSRRLRRRTRFAIKVAVPLGQALFVHPLSHGTLNPMARERKRLRSFRFGCSQWQMNSTGIDELWSEGSSICRDDGPDASRPASPSRIDVVKRGDAGLVCTPKFRSHIALRRFGCRSWKIPTSSPAIVWFVGDILEVIDAIAPLCLAWLLSSSIKPSSLIGLW